MKIQCDVCEKMEASVFCAADEAALCHACDCSIHHANKLASKHPRFSLHSPSSKDSPLCDICQEKRGYVFCREDRAIVCRECDIMIHRANEHTLKHNRFVLTGIKLSASSLDIPSYSSSLSPSSSSSSSIAKRPDGLLSSSANRIPRSSSLSSSSWVSSYDNNNNNMVSDSTEEAVSLSVVSSVSTSSISEYLIETIPGFCFEDLLNFNDASFPPNGFCKNNSSYADQKNVEVRLCFISIDKLGF